jgi:SAM-dependent methyltransferase
MHNETTMLRRTLLPVRVLVHTVRRRGVRETVGLLWRSARSLGAARRRTAADRAFDSDRNVDTAGWVRRADLVTDSPNRDHAGRYQPSTVEEFELLMGKLDIDHEEFVFVDYGSGKGRVLLLAADLPFKQIVGVEFSPPLHEIARANVATLGRHAARVETLVMDAAEYEPPLEPLVLYFFNPFDAPVMRRVLSRVRASLERRDRPVYIIVSGQPELARAIEFFGFTPVDVEDLGWATRGVYSWRPRVPTRSRAARAATATLLAAYYR